MNGRGEMTVTSGDMQMFANVLSRFTGRPVVNKTDLTGKYDFTLKWTPDETDAPMMPGQSRPEGAAPAIADASGPSIFTAVQDQLGLKLEAQKNSMEVLVIQHVERPSEN